MSTSEIDLAVQDFTANVQLLLQQKGSLLRPCVMQGNYIGKAAQVVDQVGAINATKVAGKFTPIGRTDTPNDQRWVFPADYEVKPQMVDSFDQLRLKITLEGPFTESASYALGRGQDDEIIAAFFATSSTGVDHGSTETFGTTLTTSAGRNVAVATGAAAATGLNVAKLIEGMRQLKANQVDTMNDPIYCGINAKAESNLLSDVKVVSRDFGWADAPRLVDGSVKFFVGANMVMCERFGTGTDDASSTSRMLPLFARSGMHFGIWNDIKHSIKERPDITSIPWQVYSIMTCGSTRIEGNKVMRLWSYEG